MLLLSTGVSFANHWILNNPYPDDAFAKIYYSSFAEQPKTLDPAKSYSSNEYQFIAQIYEPPLQYDYFIRPYTLAPLIAAAMPRVRYLNKNRQSLRNPNPADIAFSVYTLHIKPGIYYQPHPALAKNAKGEYVYFNLDANYLEDNDINKLSDFKNTGTRELIADDYLYQIKRLASPVVNSPIYGLMSEYIEGFDEFGKNLPKGSFIDLRNYSMAGLHKIDDYTFEITIKGLYPQFMFWLAMPFFAPIPWEADKFYSQPGMDDKNLSFDWYPIGTGAFMLTENNPNRRMVLRKNPNFRDDFFPAHGSVEDEKEGFLQHAGEKLPLIDQAVFILEKESIPRWNKFLQGYYDLSGISADSFDQAIQINAAGKPTLTTGMRKKKIRLVQTTDPTIFYMGFNMLDPVVGGNSERARKLRLAISIAVNYDEYIAIFYNGRGKTAQGPIPPGIFGYKEGREGINPYVYRWEDNKPQRRSIADAKRLMREAGYADGIDPKTQRPLILHYDAPISGGPDDKAMLDWMRKQFASIGIDLNIRATQYNRFQDKMRTGNAQIFSWGWHADYPDPENFLFMLYGPNSKVKHNGENAANYKNPRFDRLFELMKNRSNDAERQKIIDTLVEIVRHDAPWAWGINTQSLILSQQWVSPTKPNTIGTSGLKYMAIDVGLRSQLRELWNKPVLWPIGLLFLMVILLLLPLLFAYYQKERRSAPRIKL
ncbi:ABC transporter substrate-binding protein [Legionella jamestowniensis]|uniref:Extracellular solute-binding protein n=2 Tax=Legionella jamestowniensis TaxID=455 RepID=A0A0W0UFX6_9GAMM|nr:ABC transporter substrate-binding protein [Legionella jamestowniensis]KTD06751.1 extracellular solute-binding protein [Legionella jamestowniensis]OCH97210.1 peptide ABC transporter substrate-binding protein [Legionella jamestowniensis]SFL83774.1 ABC-type oligopeptide transport system, substrate-binding protein [Legionella jamestowniensis DSM 19215]